MIKRKMRELGMVFCMCCLAVAGVTPMAMAADWTSSAHLDCLGQPDGDRVILYDNGPLVTTPGGGSGGADISELQTALGMNTLGGGCQFSLGYHMADDFEVTGSDWSLSSITFYSYQTGSSTTSTLTGIYVQIWDGPPDDAGSTVVWGDLTTNRMTGTDWTSIYRVTDTTATSTDRPVMYIDAAVDAVLSAGTYWVDYGVAGSLASGPWVPPVTISGMTTTGNAKQYTSAWAAFVDSGTTTGQGVPFVINGTLGGATPTPTATATPDLPTATPTETPVPPTVTPTETPVPPTVTPTPEPECTEMGCVVDMPSTDFGPGDECYCNVYVCNTGDTTRDDLLVFVILDVYGTYFFAPTFGEFDYYDDPIEPGETMIAVLPSFTWPTGTGTASDIKFYAAMTDEAITTIEGSLGSFTFGWH